MDFFKMLENKNIIYNENQKKAISHVKGPLLIAAGPGSGKTSVITARAAYLILSAHINPSNILVITYTRAAANEMKERFRHFYGISKSQYDKVDFGTFHSTFYKIINAYYGRHIPVLDRSKAISIIRNVLRSLNEPYDDEIIDNLMNEISLYRTSPDNSKFQSSNFPMTIFMHICNLYESQKHNLKCIDFDDMIIMCKKILQTNSDLLRFYRNKYKYIMVDEFQDTGIMQFEIINLLAEPEKNICVVGDDDQSIYSFRGILKNCLGYFKRVYNGCNEVTLNINYRSTEEIVNLSKMVICKNNDRLKKDLVSTGKNGEHPIFVNPLNEEDEAKFVAEKIETLKNNGYSYNDFAVLCRTNIQARPIIDELTRRCIPFNTRDNIFNFYDHWICRDLLSYLHLTMDNNIHDFQRIINRPVRYLPKEIAELISRDAESFKNSLGESGLKPFQIEKIQELFENLKKLKMMSPSSAVSFIRKQVGYDSYIRSYCMESGIDSTPFFDIMEEFAISSAEFTSIPDFLSHIVQVSNLLKVSRSVIPTKDYVTISTIHSAKGLEFTCIFLVGAVEELIPHKKSIECGENIDEERRLFYVAITRAKNELFISSPKRYHNTRTSISRFCLEALNNAEVSKINNEFLFEAGTLLSHKFFGTGKIVRTGNGLVTVRFNKLIGQKKLDIKTCLEKKIIKFQK